MMTMTIHRKYVEKVILFFCVASHIHTHLLLCHVTCTCAGSAFLNIMMLNADTIFLVKTYFLEIMAVLITLQLEHHHDDISGAPVKLDLVKFKGREVRPVQVEQEKP